MTNAYSLLRSRTFYSIVAMAVVGAGNAVLPVVPVQYSSILVVLLGLLASYFHLATATSAGATN